MKKQEALLLTGRIFDEAPAGLITITGIKQIKNCIGTDEGYYVEAETADGYWFLDFSSKFDRWLQRKENLIRVKKDLKPFIESVYESISVKKWPVPYNHREVRLALLLYIDLYGDDWILDNYFEAFDEQFSALAK